MPDDSAVAPKHRTDRCAPGLKDQPDTTKVVPADSDQELCVIPMCGDISTMAILGYQRGPAVLDVDDSYPLCRLHYRHWLRNFKTRGHSASNADWLTAQGVNLKPTGA